MTKTYSGSCQCGAVKFEATGDIQRFFLCHCKRCRKNTGSAHAANLFLPGGTLAWLSGEENVRTYRVPETRHGKSFCVECGAALPRARDGMVVVPAGSLDVDVDFKPTAHIFLEFKANWDDGFTDVPRFDALPG